MWNVNLIYLTFSMLSFSDRSRMVTNLGGGGKQGVIIQTLEKSHKIYKSSSQKHPNSHTHYKAHNESIKVHLLQIKNLSTKQ